MTENAITTKSLTKIFGKFTAVDNLNLEIKTGELFGLLGPNGAGKTTAVRMLCTLLKPTRGTAIVAGYDIVKHAAEVRRRIGVVSEGVLIYKDLTIEENLKFIAKLYDLPKSESETKIRELLELFEFEEKSKRLIRELSTGWMKKALVCTALLHSPKILFLDEVTAGLDPQTAIALRSFTRNLCDQGVTVIWTTHYMQEPENICDRVGIIFDGRLIQIGTPRELKRSVTELSVIEIETPKLTNNTLRKIRKFEKVCSVAYNDPILKVRCEKDEKLAENITKILLSEKAKIKSISTKEPTLEDAFITLTGGEQRASKLLEQYEHIKVKK